MSRSLVQVTVRATDFGIMMSVWLEIMLLLSGSHVSYLPRESLSSLAVDGCHQPVLNSVI